MPITEKDEHNKKLVTDLYKALVSKDTKSMQHLLASDLEWWFHGPPRHSHYLVSLLTGSSSSKKSLVPNLIIGFGSVIVAEGYDEKNMMWWVHAWSISDGIITEVREYVNTSVTVTKLGFYPEDVVGSSCCRCIWKSKLSDASVPGLILTI
ncbi:unnamed protein product [Lathyrus sativus]|nr:unnamed protein product [Lathyrus sativus]